MDPTDNIADYSDCIFISEVTTVAAEMKISRTDDKTTNIASNFNQSSKNQKLVQNHNPKYKNKLCHVRNNNIKTNNNNSPHDSQNDSLQMNHTIVKSTLAKEMVKQNSATMAPTDVNSGILGVNQGIGINKENNYIPESKAPQEARSSMFWSKCGSEVIKGKHFSLYPPKHSIAVPLSSEKVPNCRTVWVVGLPKTFTDNIIHEIFGRFGKIEQLSMKTRSSCRIRYISEKSAQKAISFSGYTLVVRDSKHGDQSGLLFVDFSQSHNDVIAWKEKQILQKRIAPITNSCTHSNLTDAIKKIKSNEDVTETLEDIASWIIRGECNKYNAVNFYDIMCCTIASARRLQNKKGKTQIAARIDQIKTLLEYFYHPTVWCYFSLPQRSNIEVWRAEIEGMKSTCDNLKMSGDGGDEPSSKKIKPNVHVPEKNDRLLLEIEAYKNEIITLKTIHKLERDELNKRLEISEKSLKTSDYELMKLKIERNKIEAAKTKEIKELRNEIETGLNKRSDLERKLKEMRFELDKIRKTKDKEMAYLKQLNETSQAIIKEQENNIKEFNELQILYKNLQEMSNNLVLKITNLQEEKSTEIELLKTKNCEIKNKLRSYISLESPRLIGLISTFLLPSCLGTQLDDILVYIRRFQVNITKEDLESLMSRCCNVFKKNSDGNWILNIYNATEPPEDKEKDSKQEPLECMTQIVDLLSPLPTSIQKRKNMEKTITIDTLNSSSDMSNSRSSPGTILVKEMTQLNWINKIILIEHIISLPLNSVWSETIKNAILLLRPKEIPLTEKYCILVKLKKSYRAIDIPPTTQEKMDSLKNFEFPSTFPEETKKLRVFENGCKEPTKRSTDNPLDYSATTSKKRRRDDDLRKIEYKNHSATGDLNALLKIYDGILKEGEHLCEMPSEPVPCIQEFAFNMKNMFKHITIIHPLLKQIKNNEKKLSKTFSVLSVQYYDFFAKVLKTLPCFGNSDISKTDQDEPKINFHEPPCVRVKVIKKHAAHAQSFLKKLKIQFEYLIEHMKVEHKMLEHYESFVANIFKYFSRLDFSLNHVARTLDELVQDLKLKEMLATIKKKTFNFETAKEMLVIIAKNIKTLRADINNIASLLDSLKYYLHDIMKQDYDDHRLNFKDDVIIIIEQIVTHFSNKSFKCESLNNIITKRKSVPEKLDILSKKSRSTSMMLKTVIKKIQQINSPKILETETFNDCKDTFDYIIKYLSKTNESILAFRSPLELLIKKHANNQKTNTNEAIFINRGSINETTTREFTGKLDELRAIYQTFSVTKSFILSVEDMELLEKVYLGVENVHKLVRILNSHLSSIREFIKNFLGEDTDEHFSILSEEYFEVIENIFKLFLKINCVRKSSSNDATFKNAISCANFVKEIISSLDEILEVLQTDLILLRSKYSFGKGCQEFFGSIHKYFLNLSKSLSLFLFSAVNLINKTNERKYSASLEELYNLYKIFSENTDSSVLQDRNEISVSVLSKLGLMINVRQQFSTIKLLLNSLEVELKDFNYDETYKDRSSILGDEYFSVIDGFIKCFPESLVKKIGLSKIHEIDFKIVQEPVEKRINNLELQVNKAIDHLNEINLEGFLWETNKFADSKDFLESFVLHLLYSLDFLQYIRFLSGYLKERISTKKIHCDKESLNATVNENQACDSETQQNVDLSETFHGEQSGSFDTETPASDITNQINKIIRNPKRADNLKLMYDAYQFFKNKQNIQFPTDLCDVIDEDFLNVMSEAVIFVRELHEIIIVIRGLLSVLNDDPDHQQDLYALSEDYFIIFNEFFYGFLTKSSPFDIESNYRIPINLELKTDELNHFLIYRRFIKKVFRLLPKLRVQFEQIRKITIEDKNIFSNCQKFFEAVFQYFQYLNDSLIHFRDFFFLPTNKDLFCQIYAKCNNEFPINSRMIENKYLICFTDTLNTQEYLNITIENEQSEFDEKPAVFCTPKKETASDFAKTTQKLRNELQELFEDSPDSKKIWNNFEDDLDHHVGADQC